jgi:hypothetical protein
MVGIWRSGDGIAMTEQFAFVFVEALLRPAHRRKAIAAVPF